MDPTDLAVSVVLPTYNEAQTLPLLVPEIAAELERAELSFEIIVVDDGSPDGTAAVARALSPQYPIRVIERREERGLATAVMAGFESSRARVCVVMDADGSHPVSVLPKMVRTVLDDRSDIVVGSRHVSGGGSAHWPLFSQLKSRFAASLAMGITTMTDPTTGFMAVRRSLLEGLELDPVGWKIVLETVVKANPSRVTELPIVFTDRTHGQSKQSAAVLLQYAQHLGKLYAYRYPGLWEFLLFCTVGLLGLVVDLSTVVVLKENFNLDTRLCAVGGFAVAVTSNFVLNRRWTFPRARELPWLSSYATFVSASLLGLSVRITTVHVLMQLPRMDLGYGYVLTNIVGIVGATAFNFVGAKFFAFDPDRLAFEREAIDTRAGRASVPPIAAVRHRGLWVAVALGLCLSAVMSLHDRQLRLPDEGINVTMARNITRSSDLLLRPSVYPGGKADWVMQDLPELGNLPLYPALLSLADRLGGLAGMGGLSLLCLWISVLFTARTVAQVSERAGLYVGVLMLSSPALLGHFRQLEFEPMLVACCAAGLFLLTRGVRARSVRQSALGGALLGLGFLVKMWLIVPYALAGVGFFIVQGALARASGGGTRLRQCAAAASAGFLLVAGAHLALIVIASQQDLGLWLRHVYLGIFTGAGVTGAKLSAIGEQASHSPVWYYPALLYREHAVLLPLTLLGLPALLRAGGGRRAWLLAAIALGVAGLVPLSVPAIKEPLYALAVLPFLYMAAGLGLAAFEAAEQRYARVDASMLRMVLGLCLALVVLQIALQAGEDAGGWGDVARHAGAMALCALVGYAWLHDRGWVAAAVAGGCLLSLSVAVFDWSVQRDDSSARLAKTLAPYLPPEPAAEASYVAPGHQLLRGYLGRTGIDLTDLAQPADPDDALRAFVLTNAQLSDPGNRELLHWLTAHTTELEQDAGNPRIFIRDRRE